MTWMRKVLTALLALSLCVGLGAAAVYTTVPLSNTQQLHFDVIIVLGYPANSDGSPSAVERARVLEAVREYRRGRAPSLIMTGGPAHNQNIEADTMANFAVQQGVPAAAVLREERARNTIENAYYSVQMMQSHGWRSAEVVSSRSHLPRASLIFARFRIQYAMHGADDAPEAGWLYNCVAYISEVRNTNRIRLFGFNRNPYLP